MRYVLMILLFAFFAYALALVLQNGALLPVDLLFAQVPAMRLGLLLLLTLILGAVIGLLLGVMVFGVFQKSWEINRLRKEVEQLRRDQIHNAQLSAAEAAHVAAINKQEKTVLEIQPK